MLTIRALIDERTHVHDVLETAEAKYLESLIPASTNITTHTTNETVSSLGFNTGSSRNSASDMDALNTDFSPAVPQGSAFLEVQQRSSVIRHKGKLMIGQKIIRDEDGTFIPAPDDEDPFCDRCAEGGMDAIKEERSPTPEGSSAYLRPSPTKERPISQDSAFSTVDKVRYSQLSVRPVSQLDDAELDRLRADIAWSRARLTKLNAQTDRAQNLALTALTSGSATVDTARVGCIIVGRGVRSLPHAVDIEGRSKEDIMWDNLGEPSGVTMFWVKVVGVTLLAAAFCLPFLGLAVASAPGVSSRLTFLEPLSKSNGLGSGIAEGLIAALSITLALVGGVKLIERELRQTGGVLTLSIRRAGAAHFVHDHAESRRQGLVLLSCKLQYMFQADSSFSQERSSSFSSVRSSLRFLGSMPESRRLAAWATALPTLVSSISS